MTYFLTGILLLSFHIGAAADFTSEKLWRSYQESPNSHPNIPNCSYAGYHYSEKQPKAPPVIANVKDFGAKGDGKADDTIAFEKALRSASKGGSVFVPSGTYRITGVLRVDHSGVVLRGQNEKTTVLKFEKSLTDILGPRSFEGDSAYSWFGGLIFVSPEKDFVDGKLAPDFDENWATWDPIANIIKPAKRGDFTVEVKDSSQLKVGQKILLAWKNLPDHSLLVHIAGHPRMEEFPWEEKGRWLTKMSRVHWPVEIANIQGRRVTLRQPLRLDIRPEWDVRFENPRTFIEEVGIENLTLQMESGASTPHNKELGFNGIYLNKVFNGWIRNVVLENVDSGILLDQTKNISVEHFIIKGDRFHHHGTLTKGTHDSLFSDFRIESPLIHGINNEGLSSGNVWRRGVMTHGTFDMHRMMPYEFLRTDIKIHNDGTPGGSKEAGPIQGVRAVHWNIEASGNNKWIYQPELMPMGALVGIRGISVNNDLETDGMVSGDKGCLVIDSSKVPSPKDLFEAQLKLRMQGKKK